eukprot:6478374-Amphidinium_carterae.1
MQAHPTHDIQWYHVIGVQEEDQGYLIACLGCGCYAASRIGGLARPCLALDGDLSRGLQQQRTRLQRGLHPNCRAAVALRLERIDPLEEAEGVDLVEQQLEQGILPHVLL